MPSIEEIPQNDESVQTVAKAIAPLEEKSIQIETVKETEIKKELPSNQKPKDTGPRLA
jgi:hypothetical protein